MPVGYSGHEVGLATTVAAVALGACMVERHITLDRAMWGSDQAASVEPHGLPAPGARHPRRRDRARRRRQAGLGQRGSGPREAPAGVVVTAGRSSAGPAACHPLPGARHRRRADRRHRCGRGRGGEAPLPARPRRPDRGPPARPADRLLERRDRDRRRGRTVRWRRGPGGAQGQACGARGAGGAARPRGWTRCATWGRRPRRARPRAHAGLGLAPADASPEARRLADRILAAPGGRGAVAEAVSLVLRRADHLEDSGAAARLTR